MTGSVSSLRVLLVANYLPDHQRSMQRYGSLLAEGLQAAGVAVSLIRPHCVLGWLGPRGSRVRRLLGYIDKFVLFPLALWWRARRFVRAPFSIVHVIDQGNGVYMPLLRKLPHVLTCHDLIAIRSRAGLEDSGGSIAGRPSTYQRWNLRALRQVQWLACVSESSRQDCLRYLRLPPERCTVVCNPVDPFFLQIDHLPRPPVLPEHYVLHVGNSGWYKNRPGLIRIYHELRALGYAPPLVLLGEPLDQPERTLAEQLQLTEYLQVIANPDDALVRAAYAHADALIFPSLMEGFGWPILEALSQGTIVFTTNAMPMTEVGGAAAWYIDPSQPRQAAKQISEVLSTCLGDPAVAAAGRAQARSFSIDRFISDYLHLYQRVIDHDSEEGRG